MYIEAASPYICCKPKPKHNKNNEEKLSKAVKSGKRHKKLLLHDMNATEAEAGVPNGLKCASTRTHSYKHTYVVWVCVIFVFFFVLVFGIVFLLAFGVVLAMSSQHFLHSRQLL